jgi:cytochrome P450
VTKDTIINGWKFEKGNTVMIPFRTIHYDPKTFGERVDEFVPDRFLKDFIKTDASNGHTVDNGSGESRGPSIKSMKPFGGGATFCPGRHFAGNEALAFIATALRRFDIQLVEGQKEAKPLTSSPAAAVYPPDREIFARIRLRG